MIIFIALLLSFCSLDKNCADTKKYSKKGVDFLKCLYEHRSLQRSRYV